MFHEMQDMVNFSTDVIQDLLIRGLNDTLREVKVDRLLEDVEEYVARKERSLTERGTVSVEVEQMASVFK